jgi:metal-responsive CopG/Arc/MetJ family transcriptional regulator
MASVRTHVLIPEEILQEVDALVGPRRRSEFFAEAATEKLARDRLSHLFRRATGSLV